MRNEIQMDSAGLKIIQLSSSVGLSPPSAQLRHNKGFQVEKESLDTLGTERPRGIWDLGASRCCRVLPSLQLPSPASFHLLLPIFPPLPLRFPSCNDSSPALSMPNKSQENPNVFHLRRATSRQTNPGGIEPSESAPWLGHGLE